MTEAVGLMTCIWEVFGSYFDRNSIVTKAGFFCLVPSSTIQG